VDCSPTCGYGNLKINHDRAKAIVRILIESQFYFDLPLEERYGIIRFILAKIPFSA